MATRKTSIPPLYFSSFSNQHTTIPNQPLKLSPGRIVMQQQRPAEYNPSTERRTKGGFYSSTCCKGIIAALITAAIVAASVLPSVLILTNTNKDIETNSMTGSTTVSSTTTTTGATTAIASATTTGAATTASATVTTTITTTMSSTSTSTTTTTLHTGWNTTAITVAGTGSSGVGAAQFNDPVGLAVDSSRTLCIADRLNNRVQTWLNGASTGTTVAGSSSGTAGSSVNYLDTPLDVELDSSGNIYIADSQNHRVVLWTVGATSGTVVAGTGIQGAANNQLYRPYGVVHDWNTGILYIADTYNDRIMSYASGATTGTKCIGGTGLGTTQLNFPTGVYFDSSSNSLYIANTQANNVVRWVVGASNWILVAGSTSGTSGISSTLLNYPRDVTLDYMKNVYVADCNNNRIQFFSAGRSNGTTIAGNVTGSAGSTSNLLDSPIALVVDSDFNVYVADYFNHRIQRFDHY